MAADPLTKSTVDDLFNLDFSDLDDDPFTDKPTTKDIRDDKAVLSPRAGLKRKADSDDKENDGLGLDEEVKIAKKRRPVAKLDEARLLSEPGIPKLRAITRSGQLAKKLRLKGKGHEFSDAARLLNHFQLWLDNLYPRAKFADALQLVEKAGHTKRMHIMRTEWINEGKPGYKKYDDLEVEDGRSQEPDLFGTTQLSKETTTETSQEGSTSIFRNELDDDGLFIPDSNRPAHAEPDNEPNDDELDALLAEHNEQPQYHSRSQPNQPQDDSEGEDDLDALLAEQHAVQKRSEPVTSKNKERSIEDEDEDDDLDALLAEQEAQTPRLVLVQNREEKEAAPFETNSTSLPSNQNGNDDDDDDEDDDLEALLAMQRTRSKPTQDLSEPSLPTPQPTSSPTRLDQSGTSPQTSTTPTLRGNGIATGGALFSSSPMPNNPEDLDLDDLDALLASQEAKEEARKEPTTPTARRTKDVEEVGALLSSPLPNEESQ